jgi:hypothetical protein
MSRSSPGYGRFSSLTASSASCEAFPIQFCPISMIFSLPGRCIHQVQGPQRALIGVAVADIKPRDMNELTLRACLSGVYDRVEASRASIAVIGY